LLSVVLEYCNVSPFLGVLAQHLGRSPNELNCFLRCKLDGSGVVGYPVQSPLQRVDDTVRIFAPCVGREGEW
jgi:hypothetical protein